MGWTSLCTQTHITYKRHEPSYKQLGVMTRRIEHRFDAEIETDI